MGLEEKKTQRSRPPLFYMTLHNDRRLNTCEHGSGSGSQRQSCDAHLYFFSTCNSRAAVVVAG
jgi:hypothetical protein